MKKKKIIPSGYQIYDLSNPHLENVAIVTAENENIIGQFVKFKVTENSHGYKIYPSEKFCFLPIENRKEFWDSYKINNGIFNKIPRYIKEFGLDGIKKITIEPILIS